MTRIPPSASLDKRPMRPTQQALASITALLVFASCVTPPPAHRDLDDRYASSYDAAPGDRARRAEPARPVRASYPQERYGDDRYGYEPRYDSGRDGPDYDERYENRYDRDRYSPPPMGRLALHLGGRRLDDEGFGSVDQPGVFAIEFNTVPEPGNIGFEFGLNFGFDSEDAVPAFPGSTLVGTVDQELSTAELYAGIRAEFGQGQIRPYIGGGGTFLSITRREIQGFQDIEQDDSALGAYVHGGIQADLNENFFIGIDYRHVFGGTYEFGDTEFDGSYDQLAFTLGFNL